MNQQGKHGSERDDDTENAKLLEVSDNDRIDDLRAHLELQRNRQRAPQRDDHVVG